MGQKSATPRPTWGSGSILVVASNEVLSRELDGELVLYHPATDKVTHLDAVAAQVWHRLNARVAVDALIAGLVEDFNAEHSTISADVVRLLDELFDAQLVHVT